MPPVVASIISGLISNGLPKVADAVLEKGLDYVEKKLGIKLKPENEMTHDDAEAIRREANRHDEFMVEAANKNTADARDMQEKAMASNDPVVRRFVYVFIAWWSVFATIYIPVITFADIPEANVRFADTILGFLLGTMVASMFNFLLGSSFGSHRKDEKK